MIGSMVSAEYDSTTGAVKVLMNNTSINGYQNTVLQYQSANTLSVPLPGNLVDVDVQNPTQMQIVGYNTRIIDSNYSIAAGEYTAYSQNWYSSVRNGGVEVQQANSANKENLMAGQSTNQVLSDILQYLQAIYTYLLSHTHAGGTLPSGNTGPVVTPPPIDTTIVADEAYINANHNLFITGTYEPK